MKITLVRHGYLKTATLGRLSAGDLHLVTLEEPWSADPDGPGGQRREPGMYESCVPDGNYLLVPHTGEKFQDVWCLVNPELGVYRQPRDIPAGQKWGRSAILIHNGNVIDHTIGCILVGTAHVGCERTFESRIALEKLREVLGTNTSHHLEIRPSAGTKEQ